MLAIIRRVARLAVIGGIALISLGTDAQPDQPRDYGIIVGPEAKNMSEKQPAHLSIRLKNKIRWTTVGNRVLRINFPADGFPALEDGTRVTLPPLSGMVLNRPKTQWFPSGLGGTVNPDLSALIGRAPSHELAYTYRVIVGDSEIKAILVIQE